MDKKKLIGTIIGVIAFAALIAGATFAWLTQNAAITNGTYNFGTMNFSVTYSKGTDVTTAPPSLSAPTTSTAHSLNVKANKVSGSAPGNLTIYLNTSSTTLTANALNYAVCIGNCSSTDLTAATYKGTVSGTGKVAILSNTPLQASQTTYNIYLWLDPSKVSGGETYSGYISAEAVQTES